MENWKPKGFGQSEGRPTKEGIYLEWGGADGTLSHYNKAAQKRVQMELPLYFLPFASAFTVRGFDGTSGYWSNEAKDHAKDVVKVRNFGDSKVRIDGTWVEIKDRVKTLPGAKYASVIHGAYMDLANKKWKPAALILSGAALNAWIDTKFDFNHPNILIITCGPQMKNGAVKYFAPQFGAGKYNAEHEADVWPLYEAYQAWWAAYHAYTQGGQDSQDGQGGQFEAVSPELPGQSVAPPPFSPAELGGMANDAPDDNENLPF